MARIELTPGAIEDLDRFFDHLRSFEISQSRSRVIGIVESLSVLSHSPQIGRPFAPGLRELIIGRRPNIYLALYRYIDAIDTVFILAFRQQNEQDYKRHFNG